MFLDYWKLRMQTGKQEIPVLVCSKQNISDVSIVEAAKNYFRTISQTQLFGNILLFPLHTENVYKEHLIVKNLEELVEKEYLQQLETFQMLHANQNLLNSIEKFEKKN